MSDEQPRTVSSCMFNCMEAEWKRKEMWYNHIKKLSYPYARTKDIKSCTTPSSETSTNCQCHVNIASHKWAMDSRQPLPLSVRSSTCWGRLTLSCLLQTLHTRNCSHSGCTLRRVWVIGSSLSPVHSLYGWKVTVPCPPIGLFHRCTWIMGVQRDAWKYTSTMAVHWDVWECTPTIQERTRAKNI